jgi:hypothetical protein
MAEPIYFAPLRVPLVDPRTGLMAREWYLFFQALWLRSGGTDAPTSDDLLQNSAEGIGTSDLQALLLSGDQGLAQEPTLNPHIAENLEWLTLQVSSLNAALAEVLKQLQDIKLAINTGN